MADLVPEMAEDSAIGFAEAGAHPLALDIVRLDQVERDQPGFVAGRDLDGAGLLADGIVEEIERQARRVPFAAASASSRSAG
jgi:hypothetical protein